MNVELEISDLKRRIDELESEVDGEKLLTRYIYETTKRTETKVDRLENRVGGVETRLDGLEANMGKLADELRTLREDLPGIVANAMRDVMKEA